MSQYYTLALVLFREKVLLIREEKKKEFIIISLIFRIIHSRIGYKKELFF